MKLLRIVLLLASLLVLMLIPVVSAFAADGDPPAAGELVINEIMINPAGSESGGEWIEIKNITGESRDLNGCSISDGEGIHAWTSQTLVQAGEYFLLCYDPSSTNAPSGCDVDYANGIQLSNEKDKKKNNEQKDNYIKDEIGKILNNIGT